MPGVWLLRMWLRFRIFLLGLDRDSERRSKNSLKNKVGCAIIIFKFLCLAEGRAGKEAAKK